MENSLLVKFGQYEHLRAMQDKGHIYMNTLSYFRTLEDDVLRGDPCDYVEKIINGNHGYITVKDSNDKIKITKFTLRTDPDNIEEINIFSMYALRPSHGTFPVDCKNFEFGEHALLFHDSQELMRRIIHHAEQHKIPISTNLVDYIPETFSGSCGAFKKLNKFSYQSEWRVVCKKGNNNPRILKLGSLTDISTLIKSKDINREVTVL